MERRPARSNLGELRNRAIFSVQNNKHSSLKQRTNRHTFAYVSNIRYFEGSLVIVGTRMMRMSHA